MRKNGLLIFGLTVYVLGAIGAYTGSASNPYVSHDGDRIATLVMSVAWPLIYVVSRVDSEFRSFR